MADERTPDGRPMIDKLEMLLALAQEQHFGRAAEACGVTQPTLSAGLKQLEESFGVLLVQRQSRFIGFTPEGLRVLDWARRIVGDYRAMREEIRALKRGLAGHLRIAAIPTALPIVSALTTPLHTAHPEVVFTVLSRNSIEMLALLDNLEVDAGLSYVGNEPLGRARAVPLYQERYRLLIAADRPLGDRQAVTWAQVASVPLCLLTPDMQNRRIIDRRLRDAGVEPAPTLQSNSMMLLFSHVRTGQWASVMPAVLAETMGLPAPIRAIPIDDPVPPPTVGLIYPQREPLTPLTAALVTEARRVGPGWMERL
jgi:DNA-binding transcriptional LysR family regulator